MNFKKYCVPGSTHKGEGGIKKLPKFEWKKDEDYAVIMSNLDLLQLKY